MLSFRQQQFVDHYLGDAGGNATKAAAMAGYAHPHVACSRLLANVSIRQAIDFALQLSAMSRTEVLARLSMLAKSDASDFLRYDADKGPDQMPRLDLTRARRRGKLVHIKKLKASRSGGDDPLEIVEVELRDPMPPLALLAKYHGLLTEKFEVEVSADVKGMPDDELIRRATGALEGSGPTRADPGSQAPDVP
jgi:hypothetical protein